MAVTAEGPANRIELAPFPQEKLFEDARQTLHHSFLNRGRAVQEKFSGPNKSKEPSTQQENDLSWYASFANMSETPDGGVLAKELPFADENSSLRLVVTDSNGQLTPQAYLKNGEQVTVPQNGRLLTLRTLNGKKDGYYRFTTTDQEVIDIPEKDFLSLYSYAYQDSLKSALVGAEAQVADVVFDHIRDPKSTQTVDRGTLSEAIKASGQISTEPLLSCIQSKMSKKDVPPDPAAGATVEEIESHKLKKDQIDAYNAKRDQLVAGLQDHAIATQEDLSVLMSLFGEDELRAGINANFQKIADLKQKLSLTGDEELKKGYAADIKEADSEIKEYENALKTITDPKKLEIFFGLIESGKLSPEAAKAIGDSFAKGEVGEAMKKMAQENLASMSDEEKEKISKILGKDIQKALMTAGGAGLILLLLLIITGAGGPKG